MALRLVVLAIALLGLLDAIITAHEVHVLAVAIGAHEHRLTVLEREMDGFR
jgi:hypothetical protein